MLKATTSWLLSKIVQLSYGGRRLLLLDDPTSLTEENSIQKHQKTDTLTETETATEEQLVDVDLWDEWMDFKLCIFV